VPTAGIEFTSFLRNCAWLLLTYTPPRSSGAPPCCVISGRPAPDFQPLPGAIVAMTAIDAASETLGRPHGRARPGACPRNPDASRSSYNFFLVAGSLLLWLNLRQRRSRDVILTKFDDDRPDN
jgi:hypothetical protein